MTNRKPRRVIMRGIGVFAAAAVGTGMLVSATATQATTPASAPQGPKPTVVLVHGAFADASGWNTVTNRLQKKGFTVLAPANPLRGVASDAAYLRSVLATIAGPIILAGHSYGGAVITNAATGNPNVKALVYVAAFAPDQGETAAELVAKFPGSQLTPDNLVFRPYPGGSDGYINPAVFHRVFCADLPHRQAAAMAAAQRPADLSTLSEPSGVPDWRTIPSWYLVANQDRAIPPDSERFMAARMHAHTVQINSSHVAMISHPDTVTKMITDAAAASA